MCVDHPEVQSVLGRIRDRRVVTYGFSALADVRADNVDPGAGGSRVRRASSSDATASAGRSTASTCRCPAATMSRTRSPRSPSRSSSGIGDDDILAGFEKFEGVKRRFTKVGEVDGAIIIDDYAHHPTEIRAVLPAAREGAAGPRHRGRPAAPLHPAAGADGRLPERLQRCRRGVRRRRSIRPARSRSRASIRPRWSKGLRAHGHRMVQRRRPTSTICAPRCATSPPRAT